MNFGTESVVNDGDLSLDYFVGIARAVLVSLNPSPQEMRNLGIINEEQQKRMEDKRAQNPFSYKDEANKRYQLNFWFKLEQEGLAKDTFVKLNISIWDEERPISANTQKYHAINEHHRFAWVTKEELEKQTPLTKQGSDKPWFDGRYRRAKVGEEQLIKLLKLVTGTKPSEKLPGVLRFDEIIKDNYRSIGNIIADAEGKPRFFNKLLLGIQVSSEGKVYQTVWKDALHRFAGDDEYKKIQKEVVDYLKSAKGTYFYGFTGEQFNPVEWMFRRIDPTPYKYSAMASTPNTPANSNVNDEDMAALSKGAPELTLQTQEQGGADEDLPF